MQKAKSQIKLSVLMDKLCDLGWDYTAGRMSRSGMQTYDEIMQYLGACLLYTSPSPRDRG